MPTTVTKTIGATSSPTTPDYTSLASWIAACPANLVTADEIWEGQCLDQGEFTGASTLLTISGITTDSTRFVRLTCASGASFNSKAGVRTTALNYNASNGVAIRSTSGNYDTCIVNNVNYTQFVGLQIASEATHGQTIDAPNTNTTVDGCIVKGKSDSAPAIRVGTVKNSLLIVTSSREPLRVTNDGGDGTQQVLDCTLVFPSGGSGASAIFSQYGNLTIKGCAVFGFTTFKSGGATNSGSGFNATDLGTAFGSSNQTSLTAASQFTSFANDFRADSGGSLPNNGTPISGITTDISLTTRSVTTPTIGCWEVTSSPPSGRLSRASSLDGLGGSGQQAFNPSLAGV